MAVPARHAPGRQERDYAYLVDVHPAISAVQAQIEAAAEREREPITDRATARLLAALVRANGARAALEIGTNLGYSATWIADALPPDGRLTCIDVDAELLDRARSYWQLARLSNRIQTHCGRALEVLPSIPGPFDVAYIDANKDDYPAYLEAVIERLRPGGVVVVDNLLFGGGVAHDPEGPEVPSQRRDWLRILRTFNRVFLAHPQLDSTIVQISDGVGVGVKRP